MKNINKTTKFYKNILKASALILPALALAPLATIGTTKTNVAITKQSAVLKSDDSNYCETRSKSFLYHDLLIGTVTAVPAGWTSTCHICRIVLDIRCDDGEDHDGGWNNIKHYELTAQLDDASVKIESVNKKAYFQFAVKQEGFNPAFLQINTLSAYSNITSSFTINLPKI